MVKVIHPAEVIEEIEVDELLRSVMHKKKMGMRLSQICAACIEDRYELSYSFSDDETYEYHTLRILIDHDTEVASITDIIPQAVFYENEMKELFGVNIQMIGLDYHNKLYRIEVEQPLGPKKEEEQNG